MIVMLYSNHLPIGIVPSIKPKIIAKVVVSAPPHLPVRKLLFSTILIHHCFLKKYFLAKYWTLMQITYYWRKNPPPQKKITFSLIRCNHIIKSWCQLHWSIPQARDFFRSFRVEFETFMTIEKTHFSILKIFRFIYIGNFSGFFSSKFENKILSYKHDT